MKDQRFKHPGRCMSPYGVCTCCADCGLDPCRDNCPSKTLKERGMTTENSEMASTRLEALVAMGNADGQAWVAGENVDPTTAEFMYGPLLDAALGQVFIDRNKVGIALKRLATATMETGRKERGAAIWDASCFIQERYDEGLPGSCHCGMPVVGGTEGGPARQALCEHCLPIRCDAYPGECGR